MNAPLAAHLTQNFERSTLYERHGLVRVPFSALDGVEALPKRLQHWLEVWIRHNPLVVARRSLEDVSQHRVRLGVSGPRLAGGKPLRLSLSCDEDQVLDYRGPLTLREVIAGCPQGSCQRERLEEIHFELSRFGADVRVFGSYATLPWRQNERGLGVESDLDLLILASADPAPLVEFLSNLPEGRLAGLRLDGEVRLSGVGDVSWREYHDQKKRGQDAQVLAKTPFGARLTALKKPETSNDQLIARLATLADQALAIEALAYPKPGLVSPVDSGSHHDMDYALLVRARQALYPGFFELARVGSLGGRFHDLVKIGCAMERDMMRATGGINVYRGAIFNLGLLLAATALAPNQNPLDTVRRHYGEDILRHRPPEDQHGTRLRRSQGAGGALREAGLGFPSLSQHILPAWHGARVQGHSEFGSLIAALLAGMARLEDTNLLWRGGVAGLQYTQHQAQLFNAEGGVHSPNWQKKLQALHQALKSRHLSPGGSADLAACAHFVGTWTLSHET